MRGEEIDLQKKKKKSICNPPHYYIVTFTGTFQMWSLRHMIGGDGALQVPQLFSIYSFFLKINHTFIQGFIQQ